MQSGLTLLLSSLTSLNLFNDCSDRWPTVRSLIFEVLLSSGLLGVSLLSSLGSRTTQRSGEAIRQRSEESICRRFLLPAWGGLGTVFMSAVCQY